MNKDQHPEEHVVIEHLRRHLKTLALSYTEQALDEHLAWAVRVSPEPSRLLEHVLAQEATLRLEQRIERRIKASGLREQKTLEAFKWAFQPNLDKRVILELATLEFVRRTEDLLITGNPGTGKSHILQALALRACQQQLRVRYVRCVDLMDDLYAGLADGTYLERMKQWAAPTLLVIDDVGLGQVKKRDDEPTSAHALFNLLDRRHGTTSTAMSSNINLSDWGRYLGDATLAAAILDRVAMRSIRVDIDGPSYRQEMAKQRAQARKAPPKPKKEARDG
jgi:DNA replication protein DnaC